MLVNTLLVPPCDVHRNGAPEGVAFEYEVLE
jgi:hypothetical protein